MKKLALAAAFAAVSFTATAQSYIIMDNGLIITTDKNGFAYDLGQYAYPSKVVLRGGQYFIEDNSILATVDENGLFFRKYELIPEVILGKGINYFVSSEGFLYAIDRKGVLRVSESETFKRASYFGGNYFTVRPEAESQLLDIYVVTADGAIVKSELQFVAKEIVSFGGNYFMTSRGVVHTISSEGLIQAQPQVRVGVIAKRGGNYFTDTSNFFYTVSESGELQLPAIPFTLKIQNILRTGSNYFIDQQGRLFLVDNSGKVFERPVRDQDFRLAKVISL